MNKIMNAIRRIRDMCSITTPDYFIKQENRSYSREEIMQSFQEMVTGIRFSQQRSIKQLIKHLHRVLYYVCNSQAYDKQIQEFIKESQLALILSTIDVLRMYRDYLKKIVPTNATYFHFLRDSQFYMHYVIVRYVLIVGDSHHLRKVASTNVYSKITSQLKRSIFGYVIQWLYDLIQYKNSAIYVQTTTIQYLISSTFILTCGLLGRSYENTFSLMQKTSRKDLFNKLMFISIYILCDTTSSNKKNKYFLISMSISCLRKMLLERDIPDIDIFIPSYLYVDMIGFIHCPLTYEVVLRVLVSFLNEGLERNMKMKLKQERKREKMENMTENQFDESNSYHSESDEKIEDLMFVSPLTQINIWAVINLIIEKYGTYNKSVLEQFITKIIGSIEPHSMVRAYCIRIIQQLDLDLSNHIISQFFQKSKYDYCIDGQLLSVQLVIKNFRAFMQAIFSSYVQQAVGQKEVVLSQKNVWKYLVEFNKEMIGEVDEEQEDDYVNTNEIEQEIEENFEHSHKEHIPLIETEHQYEYSNKFDSPGKKNQNGKGFSPDLQPQTDPHEKESEFYEQRNKSEIYDKSGKKEYFEQDILNYEQNL